MYFGRGTYDPAASSEAQSRLKDFSGATAISSNAYFGREEEEEEGGPSAGQGGDDLNDTLAGLERGVRDAAGRLMANPDVQNLTDQIRQGALKVGATVHHELSMLTCSFPTTSLPTSNDKLRLELLARLDSGYTIPTIRFVLLCIYTTEHGPSGNRAY
jgi:hypothetical protein